MKFKSIFSLLAISLVSGLAAAFLALQWLPPAQGGLPLSWFVSGIDSWADAVSRAEGSVVNIYTSKLTRTPSQPLFDNPLLQRYFGDPRTRPQWQRQNSLGSGVVVDGNGYILTNHHVIKDADDILVITPGHAPASARVVGTDPDTDLAVIQAAGEPLPAATLGDSSALRVGDVVLAIGNPFGVGKTVTQGIISAVGRQSLGLANFEDFIQTDAAINRGNSGGALINTKGEVIGINTAILSNSGGSHGIGFAIPINMAKQVLQQILQHGRVIRGWIGASGQELMPATARALGLPPATRGVLVTAVLEHGPADRSGLQPGDVILQINGSSVHNTHQVMSKIASTRPGQNLRLTVLRGNKEFQIQLTVEERPRKVS